jgi:hypothetical protein
VELRRKTEVAGDADFFDGVAVFVNRDDLLVHGLHLWKIKLNIKTKKRCNAQRAAITAATKWMSRRTEKEHVIGKFGIFYFKISLYLA